MKMPDSTEDSRRTDALRFRAALGKLNPRDAQALKLRIVGGASRSECAAFLGVSQSAFDVLFLRAGRELRARLESTGSPGHPGGRQPYAEEVEQAKHLAATIDAESTLGGELGALLILMRKLQAAASEIRDQDSAALREEESSPGTRRRNLLWRAILLAIVGAGLFLYLKPCPPPRIISRVPQEELR
jgi:hypothetical protein